MPSDSVVLFLGLVPILQWYASIRRKRAARKADLAAGREGASTESGGGWFGEDDVERVQAWSMLAYYPLEHACESSALFTSAERDGA
jgi:hypothetical protein